MNDGKLANFPHCVGSKHAKSDKTDIPWSRNSQKSKFKPSNIVNTATSEISQTWFHVKSQRLEICQISTLCAKSGNTASPLNLIATGVMQRSSSSGRTVAAISWPLLLSPSLRDRGPFCEILSARRRVFFQDTSSYSSYWRKSSLLLLYRCVVLPVRRPCGRTLFKPMV